MIKYSVKIIIHRFDDINQSAVTAKHEAKWAAHVQTYTNMFIRSRVNGRNTGITTTYECLCRCAMRCVTFPFFSEGDFRNTFRRTIFLTTRPTVCLSSITVCLYWLIEMTLDLGIVWRLELLLASRRCIP